MEQWETYKTTIWWVFFAFATIGFSGGWGLARRNDWSAVSRAKEILWVTGPGALFISGILVPIIVFGKENAINASYLAEFVIKLVIVTVITIIWTLYLAKSKRVRNTYGFYKDEILDFEDDQCSEHPKEMLEQIEENSQTERMEKQNLHIGSLILCSDTKCWGEIGSNGRCNKCGKPQVKN